MGFPIFCQACCVPGPVATIRTGHAQLQIRHRVSQYQGGRYVDKVNGPEQVPRKLQCEIARGKISQSHHK